MKCSQFKAMVRKDCLQMKVKWCRTLTTFIFSLIIGLMIGSMLQEVLKTADENPFAQLLSFIFLLLLSPFIYQGSTNYVANEMVRDKETKMKETLKIMGLKPWIYALSFLVQQGSWLIFPCLSTTITLYVFVSDFLDAAKCVTLFFSFWLYSLGMLSLTMVLSNFFRNSKLVNMTLNVIFFIPTGIAMAGIIAPGTTMSADSANDWIQYLFWLPNFPFAVLAINTIKTGPIEYFTVGEEVALACLIVQIPLWFLVHLYLEGILPDNYGVSKSCCFCF